MDEEKKKKKKMEESIHRIDPNFFLKMVSIQRIN